MSIRGWLVRLGLMKPKIVMSQQVSDFLAAADPETQASLREAFKRIAADPVGGVRLADHPQMCPHRRGHLTEALPDGRCSWCLQPKESE